MQEGKHHTPVTVDVTERIPYLAVMAMYDPITVLSHDWDAFLAAFLALFHCNYPRFDRSCPTLT